MSAPNNMKRISLALLFVFAAALLTACGGGTGTGTGAAPTVSSPQSVRSHAAYEFWIVNHSDKVLQIINESYYGECVSHQFPTTEIEPKSKIHFVIDTIESGRCAVAVKGGLVTLDYGNSVLYVEYSIKPHATHWQVEGFGRGSIISFSGPAPVTTVCTANHTSNPSCVVKSGSP